MKAVKLPILFLTSNDLQLINLGIKQDEECSAETRQVLFYEITALSPYFVDNKEYTCIHTASQNFICPKPINEVELIVANTQ